MGPDKTKNVEHPYKTPITPTGQQYITILKYTIGTHSHLTKLLVVI